ncbi:protein DMR6-LIKE OXYGENASE 2 isoform X1 [Sesamum indicum]|uniref:Protein DMR6-LIKE OXYGENASE 2 isoform X1 n=1 Tax=Sesamum indicum TaxID=4182 RepID=A0A6I9TSS6_SESIN|nr:protein DMR6-LIKE OXYGENASE 2 isoform X1 [Sesamum indicum]
MERASFFLANGCTPLSLSHDFILPADVRPVTSSVSTSITVPVIDLNDKQSLLVKKISDACQEYGFFHIINHGVPEELCRRMMAAVSDFFKLPPEERSHLFTEDKTKPLRVFNFYLKVEGQNKVTMWSETLVHPWHASDDFANFLPRNPPHYRELASEYAKEIGWLMRRLLSLISQGLGLKKDSLRVRLGDKPRLVSHANYYPPCPQPELTLGLPAHTDLNALTVLMQSEDVTGLQVMTKDGEWIAINPLRNAFVVNIGDQIQVLSNGRYKSVHHRAVGSKCSERVSIAMFYGPNKDTVVGPVEELVDEDHPPVYRSYRYEEFLEEFHRQEGTRRRVKEVFELQH